ncbi:MAG: hypothetical protein ACNS61_05520 [Candidatus Wenzhouxiangella sp. M2_3B_020]
MIDLGGTAAFDPAVVVCAIVALAAARAVAVYAIFARWFRLRPPAWFLAVPFARTFGAVALLNEALRTAPGGTLFWAAAFVAWLFLGTVVLLALAEHWDPKMGSPSWIEEVFENGTENTDLRSGFEHATPGVDVLLSRVRGGEIGGADAHSGTSGANPEHRPMERTPTRSDGGER